MSDPREQREEPALHELLAHYLNQRQLTLGKLAERSGVPKTTIHRWLRGHALRPYYRAGLLRVAVALELNQREATRLLRAAGFPSIEQLKASPDPEEENLLRHWSTAVRHNLPAELTSFVGREAEIVQLTELLRQADSRLVTLTGLGGSGKTRLAMRVARELLDAFPDGVFFVSLATISDPRLLIETIAQSLDLRDVPDSTLQHRLIGWLRRRRVLLLLDNLEQLPRVGPEIESLLQAASGLTVLATSRTPLHVRGEHEWPIRPLPLPNRSQPVACILDSPAVTLFLQRAYTANPRDTLGPAELPDVAEICIRLDGLPLAIELAAARLRDRRPAQLLRDFPRRLDLAVGGFRDLAPRQQTLRQTIAWSVDLLGTDARRLLFRLAVFAGGWSRQAALAMDGDTLDGKRIDWLLTTLADAKLIEQDAERAHGEPRHARYRMLETIREYALEQLAASCDAIEIYGRHADYTLQLAESAPPYVPEARSDTWYERIDADVDNIRAALAWAQAQGDLAHLARFAAALWPYWYEYRRVEEGRRWVETVLPHRAQVPLRLQAALLTGACRLASTQIDFEAAITYGREAVALWQQLDDHRGQAITYNILSWTAYVTGQTTEAFRLFEAQVQQWRLTEDERGLAGSLCDLAFAHYSAGQFADAVPLLHEAERHYRTANDTQGLTRILRERGLLALLRGDLSEAIARLNEAVARMRVDGTNAILPMAIFYLGTAHCFAGELTEAARCYAESLRLQEETNDRLGLALTLLGFAAVAYRQGDATRAATLCGASQRLQCSSGIALPPAVQALYQREVEQVINQIDYAVFNGAFARGVELSADDALRFARGEPVPG